ncbi:MAG: leucine-rich repeat domain-containing protein [Firmicutes bacterium]|nr:leucine-rich repeat domain-containing protein [Bacillota bacterium]
MKTTNIKTNRRTKIITKIAIAILMALLLASSVLLIQANRIRESVNGSQYLVQLPPTFEHTRYRANATSFNQFANLNFQINSNNFGYINGSAIGNLVDPRYGVTLQHQANAIRRNRRSNGTISGPAIAERPNITVMVYGQGGTVSHWSNNGNADMTINSQAINLCDNDDCAHHNGGACEVNDSFRFAGNSRSMIEILREEAGGPQMSRVYIARSNILTSFANPYCEFAGDRNNARRNVFQWDYSNFRVELNTPIEGEHQPLLALYQLGIDALSYEQYNPNYLFGDRSGLPNHHRMRTHVRNRVQNPNLHNIIIFDTDDNQQYHEYVYNQLAAMLIQISYDYLRQIGQVPKFNFVTHSTGGNWAKMFANRFPLNVAQLITLDAPFRGTELGRLLYEVYPLPRTGLLGIPFRNAMRPLVRMVTVPSGFNNIDNRRNDSRKRTLQYQWFNATAVNPSLLLTAVSTNTHIDYVFDMVGVDYLRALSYISLGLSLALPALLIAASIPIIGPILITLLPTLIILGAIELSLLTRALEPIISYFTNNMSGNVIQDSIFIGEFSARADGSRNVRRPPPILYQNNSASFGRKVDNLANPHNVIAHDSRAHDIITNYIDMGRDFYVRNDFNHGLEIMGVRAKASIPMAGRVEVPSTINGQTVSRISDRVFYNYPHIMELFVPASVRTIGNNAFREHVLLEWENNFMFLENTFLQVLRQRGHFSIPARVAGREIRYIASSAFKDSNVSSVFIPDTVVSIGSDAFYNSAIWNNTPIGQAVIVGNWIVGVRLVIGQSSIVLPARAGFVADDVFPRGLTIFTNSPNQLNIVGIPSYVEVITDSVLSSSLSFVESISADSVSSDSGIPFRLGNYFCHWEQVGNRWYARWYTNEPPLPPPLPPSLDEEEKYWMFEKHTPFRVEGNALIIRNGVGDIAPCWYNPNAINLWGYSVDISEIRTIIIPSSVSIIWCEAFRGSRLEVIIFLEGSNLFSIGSYAFAETNYLQAITIPSSVTQINCYAFHRSAVRFIYVEGEYVSFSNLGIMSNNPIVILQTHQQAALLRQTNNWIQLWQIQVLSSTLPFVLITDTCVYENVTLARLIEDYQFTNVISFSAGYFWHNFNPGNRDFQDLIIYYLSNFKPVFFVQSYEMKEVIFHLREALDLQNIFIYMDFKYGSGIAFPRGVYIVRPPMYHTGVQKALEFLAGLCDYEYYQHLTALFIIPNCPYLRYGIKSTMIYHGWHYEYNVYWSVKTFRILQSCCLDLPVEALLYLILDDFSRFWEILGYHYCFSTIKMCCWDFIDSLSNNAPNFPFPITFNHDEINHVVVFGLEDLSFISNHQDLFHLKTTNGRTIDYFHFFIQHTPIENHHFLARKLLLFYNVYFSEYASLNGWASGLLNQMELYLYFHYYFEHCCGSYYESRYLVGFFNPTKLLYFRIWTNPCCCDM